MATSSLHALSNSMTLSRQEKHSPHSSPRLPRRTTTASSGINVATPSSSNSTLQLAELSTIQSSHSNLASLNTSSHNISTIAPSLHSNNSNVNNGPLVNNIKTNNSSGGNNSRANVPVANRMGNNGPLISLSSNNVVNRVLSKTLSAEMNDNQAGVGDSIAPPLPPRKSSPSIDLSSSAQSRLLKQNLNSGFFVKDASESSASSLINIVNSATNMSYTLSKSSENVTCCELDVPKSIAPPVPKHQSYKMPSCTTTVDNVIDDIRHTKINSLDDDQDKIIVGPEETISGIIDTRPLEARKPIQVPSNDKELNNDRNNLNNLYQFKTSNQQNHIRHQSLPMNNANTKAPQTQPSKSVTTPHFGQENESIPSQSKTTSASSAAVNVINSLTKQQQQQLLVQQRPPQLYENVTINNKDCNVPYENINLEYIARLMSEGYSKENVITALGISRNNIEMACDILHEFVTKSGVSS